MSAQYLRSVGFDEVARGRFVLRRDVVVRDEKGRSRKVSRVVGEVVLSRTGSILAQKGIRADAPMYKRIDRSWTKTAKPNTPKPQAVASDDDDDEDDY